mmetsp:Transcript_35055/g.139193  ORF Transcript_35055/g.139193 Transcript_35055/m.139193 type:complete len:144 (+) Transcript_35055:143-574(+)
MEAFVSGVGLRSSSFSPGLQGHASGYGRRNSLARTRKVGMVVQTPPSEDLIGGSLLNDREVDEAWEGLKAIVPFEVLRTISKPGRYLGNERGAVMKDWDENQLRMCLAYPETYEIGMSNTGHVILYSCLNDVDGVLCDRLERA